MAVAVVETGTHWPPANTCSGTCIGGHEEHSTMATEETTVTDRGMVRIPDSLRWRLDIEAGDKLRWAIDDEGELTVEVVKQRHGAYDDFEAVPMGGDGQESHDVDGHERDPTISGDR